MDACLADLDQGQHHHPGAVQDVSVMCLCYSSWGKWELGFPDDALRRVQTVVALAARLGHAFSIGEAHGFRAGVHHFRGEARAALTHAEKAVGVCREHGFPVWLAHGKLMHGRAAAELGDPDTGVAEMREAYAMWAATDAVVTCPFYLAMQAEGLALKGDPDGGLLLLDDALNLIERHGERYYEPEVRRLIGALILLAGARSRAERHDEAERWFTGGLESARVRDLRSLQLRSATSLASLYVAQGRIEDARGVLAPVYERFDEGTGTRDVMRARALLNQLDAEAASRRIERSQADRVA
jgi:predicted ATPase